MNNQLDNFCSPEEFEQRIDSDLAALDSLPNEEVMRQQRCSVISEDLLEFSENLIDCETANSEDSDDGDVTPVPEDQSIISRLVDSNDNSRNPTPTNRPKQTDQQQIDGKNESMTRTSDHVSCEDLLEFACDGPNTRRTRGPSNGEQSDEVSVCRIQSLTLELINYNQIYLQ